MMKQYVALICCLLLFGSPSYAQKRKPSQSTKPTTKSTDSKKEDGIYLISPKGSDGLSFEDAFIKINFLIASQLAFEITNKRSDPIEIIWDHASIVDLNKEAHRVLHAGVRYMQRDQPMPSTIIPPNAKMKDGAIPSDYVSYESNNWQVKPFLTMILDSGGQTFSLFLPMKVNGVTKNYNFVFKLNPASAEKEESQKPILIQRSQLKIQTISKSEFGSEWPFSFDETQLACANGYSFILHGGVVYLLNKTRAIIMIDGKSVETNLESIKNENAKAGTVDFTVTFRRSASLCKQ